MKQWAWAVLAGFAFGGHCAAAPSTLGDLEIESLSACFNQPEATNFADHLQGLRASGVISDDDLAKGAPGALLRLAEIERFRGQFDLAENDYAKVASVAGPKGDIAQQEMPSLVWDKKLRQTVGPPFQGQIVAVARQIATNGEAEPMLLVLWRSPDEINCDVGLFASDDASLALYRLPAGGNPVQQGEAFKIDVGAEDMRLLEMLPDGRAIVGIQVVSGNCAGCEDGAADFLIQDGALHRLKDPGGRILRGMPNVSNGEVTVETLEGRWDGLGIFDRMYGYSTTATWRLQGQEFVEDCSQAGTIDRTPIRSSDNPGTDFQSATARFVEDAQGGQAESAWPLYRAELKAISQRWPDYKGRLDKYAETLGADLERSKAEMARHRCHLEGLNFTWDYSN